MGKEDIACMYSDIAGFNEHQYDDSFEEYRKKLLQVSLIPSLRLIFKGLSLSLYWWCLV